MLSIFIAFINQKWQLPLVYRYNQRANFIDISEIWDPVLCDAFNKIPFKIIILSYTIKLMFGWCLPIEKRKKERNNKIFEGFDSSEVHTTFEKIKKFRK